jgi:hypothetical protein
MEVYKRIVFIIFILGCYIILEANDSLKVKKYFFTISTGVCNFNLRDKSELKYYDGNYMGWSISSEYVRKYFITELKYQFGKSRDAVYHFGEWNFGVKIDFLKRHGISLMTGIYVYRTQNKINLFIENLPVYDFTFSTIVPVRYRDINYPFYQGGSNFMIMDISSGKFKWAGTNLLYMFWMHLKAEYSYEITKQFNFSISGTTYFSNSIHKFVSLHTLENVTSEQLRFYETIPTKYILNESGFGLPIYENASYGSKMPNYYVPYNILFDINLSIKYRF